MKKLLLIFTPVIALAAVAAILLHPAPAHANTAFNQNNLMDDGVFTNSSSMSAAQINAWLNSNFPQSCISTNNGFSAPDPTGYSPSAGFTYGANVSAGQVIWDAAQAYGINPQVLLATLQKESSVVSGDASYHCQYINTAMGYGCPDSGSCPTNPATMSGFSKQVIHAAWLFMFGEQRSQGNTSWNIQKTNQPQSGDVWNNSDDPLTCYGGPMTQGTFKRCSTDSSPVFYDGSYTIDGTGIQIQTGSTAALYWYTPHFSGNQNFDTIFQNWFGSLYVPSYGWQILNTTYNGSSSNTVGANTNTTVVVTVKNTGNVIWYNGGPDPIHLATWPIDSTSPLYSSGWLSPTRPATLDQSQLAPGATGTFTFTIDPANTGTYVQGFNLVAEGVQWMSWPGFSPTVNVVPSYAWSVDTVTYSSGGGIMQPGTTQHITVKARNTGLATWSQSSGPPIRLGYVGSGNSPIASGWLSPIRAATMDESTVPPGQEGTFEFNVTVPGSGNYYTHLNLVAEGQQWFNDSGLTLYLRGGIYAWQPLWSAYSTGGNANIARGTTFTVTLKALNTGELPWSNTITGSIPWQVRLATTDPMNRGSFLYDSSWISDIRPATLQESTVQPGQQGTFVFTVHIPSNASPGPRLEHFSLVAEGLQWFNDPGFALYVNVI